MDRGGLAGQQGMFVSIVIAVMGAVLLTLILRLVSGGRIREMESTCQDSKRCPPLLWSLDDRHVE